MKRYVTGSGENASFATLEEAIEDAKEGAVYHDEPYYVFELVGAVHPGKPRWRPTERKERAEKPKDHPPVIGDDAPLDYKITVRKCAIGKQGHLVGALMRLTNLNKTGAEYVAESGGAFFMRGLTLSQFNNAKSHLVAAGATIDYEIL